uniref:Uncharacterized protein LOC102804815 n=1 Tax=Saccoglossus kowalevskii TaxID=10224 RepID=A0ABM0M4Y4_SACKO|nr:PREDICTED: uncharacterized protein LOC102804815 [Saccoglossus kowalevskii]
MGQEISIDEGMVRFKGRSMFKLRLSHKPDRDGFKIWQVCDSTTSYIANFEPYLVVKYKTTNEERKKETGTIKKTVHRLLQPFTEKKTFFSVIRFFTSVNTALELQDKKVYMVSSFSRRNRKTMAPQLIPEGKSKKQKLKIGEMKAATRPDDTINITAYQDDRAQILILNTVYQPSTSGRRMGAAHRGGRLRKAYNK